MFEEIKDKIMNRQQENKENVATDTNQHYQHKTQPIVYIQQVMADLPLNGFEGACIKDIIKYCSRYGLKDDEVKEASKILDYALWLLLEAKGIEIDPNKHNHSEILKHFGIN